MLDLSATISQTSEQAAEQVSTNSLCNGGVAMAEFRQNALLLLIWQALVVHQQGKRLWVGTYHRADCQTRARPLRHSSCPNTPPTTCHTISLHPVWSRATPPLPSQLVPGMPVHGQTKGKKAWARVRAASDVAHHRPSFPVVHFSG